MVYLVVIYNHSSRETFPEAFPGALPGQQQTGIALRKAPVTNKKER